MPRPIFDLDMRLGEGTGALLAWPVVRAASAMLTDMASFESAGGQRTRLTARPPHGGPYSLANGC